MRNNLYETFGVLNFPESLKSFTLIACQHRLSHVPALKVITIFYDLIHCNR